MRLHEALERRGFEKPQREGALQAKCLQRLCFVKHLGAIWGPYREGPLWSPYTARALQSPYTHGLHKAPVQRGLCTHMHTFICTFQAFLSCRYRQCFTKYLGGEMGLCRALRYFMKPHQRGALWSPIQKGLCTYRGIHKDLYRRGFISPYSLHKVPSRGASWSPHREGALQSPYRNWYLMISWGHLSVCSQKDWNLHMCVCICAQIPIQKDLHKASIGWGLSKAPRAFIHRYTHIDPFSYIYRGMIHKAYIERDSAKPLWISSYIPTFQFFSLQIWTSFTKPT